MGTFRIRLQTTAAITPGFSPFGIYDLWWGRAADTIDLTNINQIPDALSLTNDFSTNGFLEILFSSIHSGELRFDTAGVTIVLDGNEGSPLDFSSLPTGFTALTAKIVGEYFNSSADTNTYTINLEQDNVTLSPPFTGVKDTNQRIEFPYTIISGNPSMSDIVTNGCGFKLISNAIHSPTQDAFLLQLLDIEGTYSIQSFTFKLNVPQPVVAGDIVSLTSNGTDNPIDFTKVTSLTVGGIDVDSSLWTFSEFFFSFPVPAYSTLGVLEIVITSTEFSGSMSLGKITTILFKGASGIYTLDSTATHDTLYDIVNGGTVNVKIPDPFIKTFFAGN